MQIVQKKKIILLYVYKKNYSLPLKLNYWAYT